MVFTFRWLEEEHAGSQRMKMELQLNAAQQVLRTPCWRLRVSVNPERLTYENTHTLLSDDAPNKELSTSTKTAERPPSKGEGLDYPPPPNLSTSGLAPN